MNERFGGLYENLKDNYFGCIIYYLIFLMRRIQFVLIVFYLEDFPFLQV